MNGIQNARNVFFTELQVSFPKTWPTIWNMPDQIRAVQTKHVEQRFSVIHNACLSDSQSKNVCLCDITHNALPNEHMLNQICFHMLSLEPATTVQISRYMTAVRHIKCFQTCCALYWSLGSDVLKVQFRLPIMIIVPMARFHLHWSFERDCSEAICNLFSGLIIHNLTCKH